MNSTHSVALVLGFALLATSGCGRKTRDFAPPSAPLAAAEPSPAPQCKTGEGKYGTNESPEEHSNSVGLNVIQLQFLGQSYRDYSVNQYLNLTIAHQYRVQLEPTLPSGFKDKLAIRARLALALDTQESGATAIEKLPASSLITWAEIEGKLDASESTTLISDLVLRYPRVGQSLLRNIVLVELEWAPLEAESSLKAGKRTFWGKLAGLPEGGDSRLLPVSLQLGNLIESAAASRKAPRNTTSAHELYLATHKQLMLPDTSKLPQAELADFLNGDSKSSKAVFDAICAIAYPNHEGRRPIWSQTAKFPLGPNRATWDSHRDYCIAHPSSSLKYYIQDFVDGPDAILDGAPKFVGSPQSLSHSVSAGWNLSASSSESTTSSTTETNSVTGTTSVSVGTGSAFPVGLNQSFSYSTGKSWSWSQSNSISSSTGSSTSFSTSFSLVSEKLQLRIRARTLRCMTVEVGQNQSFAPIHVCESQPRERELTESYYLVRQPTFTASLFDSRTEGSGFRMLIRGEHRFNQFMGLISNPSIVLSATPARDAYDELLNPELPSLADNNWPGVIEVQN